MQAYDFHTEETKFPEILAPILGQHIEAGHMVRRPSELALELAKGDGAEEIRPFFSFTLEVNPMDGSDFDYRVMLELLPLNIIVNENIVERMSTY